MLDLERGLRPLCHSLTQTRKGPVSLKPKIEETNVAMLVDIYTTISFITLKCFKSLELALENTTLLV
jgi:hypothetical protein